MAVTTPEQTIRELPQLRIPKASELVASHLRRRIINQELSDGEFLPSEAEVMQAFQVSRPTLREAYRILENEGLLSVRRGASGGARAHQPTPDAAARCAAAVLQTRRTSLRDVFAARTLLEGPAARIVALDHTPDAIRQLDELNAQSGMHTGDPRKQLAVHHRFHNTMVRLAGNQTMEFLTSMIDAILDSEDFRASDGRAGASEFGLEAGCRAQESHLEVVQLIRQGDAAGANASWNSHLNEVSELVMAHVDSHMTMEPPFYGFK
ncbi:FCD domain-containing protein [soil metagenome]